MSSITPISLSYYQVIKKEHQEAFTNFFRAAGVSSDVNEWTQLQIKGHTVTIMGTGINIQLTTEKTKEVVVNTFSPEEKHIKGPVAEKFRKAIKALSQAASVLDEFGLLNESDFLVPEIQSPTVADKIVKVGYPIADFVGMLRNALSLMSLLFVGVVSLSSEINLIIGPFATILVKVFFLEFIAIGRIIQGVLSIVLGFIKFNKNYQLYQLAKENHDVEGAKIYKRQVIYAVIGICEGLLWGALGLLVVCNPAILAAVCAGEYVKGFSELGLALFYGGFGVDAILNWNVAYRTKKNIEKQYELFKVAVLNNPDLNEYEREEASKRFMRMILDVTPEEIAKIEEKYPANEVQKRIHEKLLKKRMIAARWGITPQLYQKAVRDEVSAYTEIQKCYEKSIAGQKAQIALAIICIVVNIIGAGEFVKGINQDALGPATDGLWVIVNFLFLIEDWKSWITSLCKKQVPELPMQPQAEDSKAV
ncbi:MAG: hypothetical protein HW387_303 [Parachlamydiales bacterium]|nr:hypothetical protein [Parachlamydiales bacterium]